MDSTCSPASPEILSPGSVAGITDQASPRHSSVDRGLDCVAGFGALLAGSCLLPWLLFKGKLDPEALPSEVVQIQALLAVVLIGALLGLRRAQAWPQGSEYRRFELQVRNQLKQGHWALVVYRVPWARQAEVLQAVQTNSLKWCAEAKRTRTI